MNHNSYEYLDKIIDSLYQEMGDCEMRIYPAWICHECAIAAGAVLLEKDKTLPNKYGICCICSEEKCVIQPRAWKPPGINT